MAIDKPARYDQPQTVNDELLIPPKVGEEVLAMGYALDLPGSASLTKGMVSAFRPSYLSMYYIGTETGKMKFSESCQKRRFWRKKNHTKFIF